MKNSQKIIEQLNSFFERPGINKAGICREVGVSQQHLNDVIKGREPLTTKFLNKLSHVAERYGFIKN